MAVYGIVDSSNNLFRNLITFDYTAKKSQLVTFDSSLNWMIDTASALSVSDSYLYVRNTANVATTTDRWHATYYISGAKLIPYFDRIVMDTT